ncbi:MAG: hypothetical protein ABIZ81_09965 [Opitutaceae bacterium]
MSPIYPRLVTRFVALALTCSVVFDHAAGVARAAVAAPIPLRDTASQAAGAPTASDLAVIPFLPTAAKNLGAAVLIVPDAAMNGNKVDAGSLATAQWLSERGLASFVLVYPAQAPGAEKKGPDVAGALRSLRARATDFKIAAERVGVVALGRGAAAAAEAAYSPADAAPADARKPSARPAFLALVWGAGETTAVPRDAPPTFLVGSTLAGDNLSGMIDLWGKLRAARVPVDAHFFAKADPALDAAFKNPSAVSWPEMFYTWVRFQGYLTEQPRLALKGMAYLDGHPLPQGYVIFTPIDFVGAGPIIARVINSTAGIPIGQFTVPASQGPIAGRYKVEVRQNMNWWLSNSFSGALVNARGGATPEQTHFGHHRVLAPSIGDQRIFTKMRSGDREDYTMEFKAGAPANNDLKIEIFTK